MAYDSKAILDDIHKANPLPDKGKINNFTKENNLNKAIDSALSDDELNAAKYIYKILEKCFNVKLKELYNPKKDGTNSKALELLIESKEKGTSAYTFIDKKYIKAVENFSNDFNKGLDYVYSNKVLSFFGYDLSEMFKEIGGTLSQIKNNIKFSKYTFRGTEGQTEFLRSANHCCAVLNNSTDDYYYDFTKDDVGTTEYKSFKNLFPETLGNYKQKLFNDEVDTGIDPYAVNAFIMLINKTIKNGVNNINIKKINIPKDKVAPEKEKSISAGNSVLSNKLKSLIRSNAGKLIKALGNGISKLAKTESSIKAVSELLKLTESTEPIAQDTINKIVETFPNDERAQALAGKTFEQLDKEWKAGTSLEKVEQEDEEFLKNTVYKWKDGKEVKDYWDSTDDLTKFFDVISRKVYLSSNGEMSLDEWDSKQDYLVSNSSDDFLNYTSNVEPGNREKDQQDLDTYNDAREESGIDNLVEQLEDATDDDGIIQDFKNSYPELLDDDNLKKLLERIVNAMDDSSIYLKDLGFNVNKDYYCIADEDNKATFKRYLDFLNEGPTKFETYRNDVYEDLIEAFKLQDSATQGTSKFEESFPETAKNLKNVVNLIANQKPTVYFNINKELDAEVPKGKFVANSQIINDFKSYASLLNKKISNKDKLRIYDGLQNLIDSNFEELPKTNESISSVAKMMKKFC